MTVVASISKACHGDGENQGEQGGTSNGLPPVRWPLTFCRNDPPMNDTSINRQLIHLLGWMNQPLFMKASILTILMVAVAFGNGNTRGDDAQGEPPKGAVQLPPIGPEPNITAGDFYDATGILAWEFTIPDDLQAGEYMGTYWHFYDDEREDERALSFQGISSGERVQIFLWVNEWMTLDDEKKGSGIRYVMKFRQEKKVIKKEGKMHVPDGFWDFCSFLGPGQVRDGGYLLYFTRRKPDAAGYAVPAAMEMGFWHEDEEAMRTPQSIRSPDEEVQEPNSKKSEK
jgi:hypothetical protein